MPFTLLARSEALRKLVGETPAGIACSHASLHTADPGSSGTSEVTGGSPAYARKALTWNTVGTDGVTELSADVVFDVPASTTVAYVGLFSAITGGTFMGSMAVSPNETFGAQGQFTLKAATSLTLN